VDSEGVSVGVSVGVAAKALAEYSRKAAAWVSQHSLQDVAVGGYDLRT
jgi:hypothetical protein